MSVRKKISTGILAGVLGVSLISGGTFAAFNDIEVLENQFASGQLNLDVSNLDDNGYLFELSNLKPGDVMTREFTIHNGGSLAIQHVLMHMDYSNFSNEVGSNGFSGSNDDPLEFLKQFEIQLFEIDHGQLLPFFNSVTEYDHPITWPITIPFPFDPTIPLSLYDLYQGNLDNVRDQHVFTAQDHEDVLGTEAWVSKDRINLAPEIKDYITGLITLEEAGLHAIEPGQSKDILMTIEFVDNKDRESNGLYSQNIFQNNSIDVQFSLEATQWHGIDVGSENGYVEENERNNPQDQ